MESSYERLPDTWPGTFRCLLWFLVWLKLKWVSFTSWGQGTTTLGPSRNAFGEGSSTHPRVRGGMLVRLPKAIFCMLRVSLLRGLVTILHGWFYKLSSVSNSTVRFLSPDS